MHLYNFNMPSKLKDTPCTAYVKKKSEKNHTYRELQNTNELYITLATNVV